MSLGTHSALVALSVPWASKWGSGKARRAVDHMPAGRGSGAQGRDGSSFSRSAWGRARGECGGACHTCPPDALATILRAVESL